MNGTEYKKYHESFMQHNQGSSATHTFLCIFFTVQSALLCAITVQKSKLTQYAIEYLVIVLPTIMAHTYLFDYIYELNLSVCILLLYHILKKVGLKDVQESLQCKNSSNNGRLESITCLRGLTYLITVICILAVDFKDFPRYLAKTEKYGYSLMDTGVGLFVLISGLVHKNFTNGKILLLLKANAKFVIILLILGITRFISIKQLDYHNHVTEYGVHWNFFYTLAVCKFLATVILMLSSQSLILSGLLLCIHELLLFNGLEVWVFSCTPRTDFIDANKEGISSSLGYVALYLYATYLKKVLTNNSIVKYYIFKKLLINLLALIICAYILSSYRQPSRTLANASYCIYVCGVIVLVLSVMYFVETIFCQKERTLNVPLMLVTINNNGLSYFLLANVITGLINMSIRTLFVPTIATIVILSVYMLLTISVIVYVNSKGIKL